MQSKQGAQMDKRHVQTFLLSSAAFFAMSLPARPAYSDMLAAAVSHTVRIASTGIGHEPGIEAPIVADEARARRS
jgi:hypothetical protein